MAVGTQQLREIFQQAADFDQNSGSLDLESLERNLIGVLDDFRNLRGNQALLQEMDQELHGLVLPVDFNNPGLRSLLAHFLAMLFENYANEGTGFRKGYDLTLEKRSISTIDGPFIYEELVPQIFDESRLLCPDSLRFFLLEQVARFLETKDPGGHWKDSFALDQVKEARPDTMLLELARRRIKFATVENLAQKAHTLEQRLAEAEFFTETAPLRVFLAYTFECWGYIERESWWTRIQQQWARLQTSRSTFGRLSRWKRAFRLQVAYMVLMLAVVVGCFMYWSDRQQAQLTILSEIFDNISSVDQP